MKRLARRLALGLLVLLVANSLSAQKHVRSFVPVTDAMLQNPDPADWLMWRRTLDSWGYSPLNQINRSNVGQLRLVWTRGLAAGDMQESTPLVHDGVMYIPNPGDDIEAIDARSGDMLWDYQRRLADPARRTTNRNIAVYGINIIDTTSDNYVIAIDAQTGNLAWETPILDPKTPALAT